MGARLDAELGEWGYPPDSVKLMDSRFWQRAHSTIGLDVPETFRTGSGAVKNGNWEWACVLRQDLVPEPCPPGLRPLALVYDTESRARVAVGWGEGNIALSDVLAECTGNGVPELRVDLNAKQIRVHFVDQFDPMSDSKKTAACQRDFESECNVTLDFDTLDIHSREGKLCGAPRP